MTTPPVRSASPPARRSVRSAVATPIIVEGRLWGVITADSTLEQPLPPDTEARLASFTDLVATAIANAESRAALAASRVRIVAAADESRRRIERDLHDGAQQRLVHAIVALKLGLRALSNGEAEAGELVAEALRQPSRRTESCASWRTAFCPRSSPAPGYARVSRRSSPVSHCR